MRSVENRLVVSVTNCPSSTRLIDVRQFRQRGSRGKLQLDAAPAFEEVFLVAAVDQAAAIDEGDAIGNALHVHGVVRGEQDRAVFVAQHVHELAEHFVAGDGVEARSGLVEYQQARAAGEGEQQHCLDVFTARTGCARSVRDAG